MKDNIRISVGQTKLLIQLIMNSGITVSELKSATGIDTSGIEETEFFISLDEYRILWLYATEVTQDPALALHLGQSHNNLMLGFGKRITQYSKDLNEALHHWISYGWMPSKVGRTEWRKEGDSVVLCHISRSSAHQSIQMTEYALSVVYNYSCYITDKVLPVISVHFIHPEPEYAAEYRKAFRSEVLFDQRENALIIHEKVLKTPIVYHDPLMVSVLEQFANNHKSRSGNTKALRDLVVEYMIANFPKGNVSVEKTSKAFFMTRSTLLRKLKQEETTFKELLDNTRKELTISYLKQDFSVKEIAYLLGFTTPSTFQHSFKRWFGINPGEMKLTLNN